MILLHRPSTFVGYMILLLKLEIRSLRFDPISVLTHKIVQTELNSHDQ
jgi:hypothetical protein